MEDRYQHTVNGQAVEQADVNLIATEAAMQDDYVLAELLRPTNYLSAVQKLIIPSARSGRQTTNLSGAGVVIPKAASDSSVLVRPFRAIVGITGNVTTLGHLKAFRDIRSVVHPGTTSGQPNTELQLSATSSNHRWDLIYAQVQVDIDSATESRYVKDSGGTVAAQNVVPTKKTTVTIAVVEGTEAASPTRPAVPSDSGSSYYFPLAYVLLTHPHTLVTAIDESWIQEVLTPAYIGEALGARSSGPADGCYYTGGYADAADPWAVGNRPDNYLPPSMHGGVTRFFAVQGLTVGTHVIDQSIDWRDRWVKWEVQGRGGATNKHPGTNTSGYLAASGLDNTVIFSAADSEILRVVASDHADTWRARVLSSGTSAVGKLQANATTGNLELVVSGATIADACHIWLDATGAYDTNDE